MGVRTYDPKRIVVNVNGIPLSGFADGSFLTIERENDAFTKNIGSDGIVSRAKSNDRSGMMTLTLVQTSLSNDVLSALLIADEVQNAGVAVITVKDLEGNSTYFAGTGWIKKVANSEFAKEISNREWVFDLAEVDVFVGGIAEVQ